MQSRAMDCYHPVLRSGPGVSSVKREATAPVMFSLASMASWPRGASPRGLDATFDLGGISVAFGAAVRHRKFADFDEFGLGEPAQ